jgi:hypothetical protein
MVFELFVFAIGLVTLFYCRDYDFGPLPLPFSSDRKVDNWLWAMMNGEGDKRWWTVTGQNNNFYSIDILRLYL